MFKVTFHNDFEVFIREVRHIPNINEFVVYNGKWNKVVHVTSIYTDGNEDQIFIMLEHISNPFSG